MEKTDKPVDPDPYNKHYRKQVDVDPNNEWIEAESSEEWSGVDPNSVGDRMLDDQEVSTWKTLPNGNKPCVYLIQ